jgi:hypothetical protein
VAVTDVNGPGIGQDTFYGAAIGRDDEVETTEVEALGGDGVEREHVTVVAPGPWDPLEERGVDLAGAEAVWGSGSVGDEGEYLGFGEQEGEALGHALATAACHKPMMNDGDPHPSGLPQS